MRNGEEIEVTTRVKEGTIERRIERVQAGMRLRECWVDVIMKDCVIPHDTGTKGPDFGDGNVS